MHKLSIPPNELAIRPLESPADRRRVVYHLEGHGNDGLQLFIQRTGTKLWYFRSRVMGSAPKDMPLGPWPVVSIAEARSRKAAIVSVISKGEDPWQKRAEIKHRRVSITLDQVFEQWSADVDCEKRTIDQDRLRYRMNLQGGYRFTRGRLNGRVFKAGIGHMAIVDIKRLDVSGCLSEFRRRSASQAHQTIILLNTVLKWARQMGYIDVNPAEDQPFRLPKKVRDRYLSEDEVRIFWYALEIDPHIMPTTRIWLRLLLLTVGRREDWAEAPKSELRDGCLIVAAERYKSKRIHRIPICPMAQEQVDAALRLGSGIILDVPQPRRLRSTFRQGTHERALADRSHGTVDQPVVAGARNAPQPASHRRLAPRPARLRHERARPGARPQGTWRHSRRCARPGRSAGCRTQATNLDDVGAGGTTAGHDTRQQSQRQDLATTSHPPRGDYFQLNITGNPIPRKIIVDESTVDVRIETPARVRTSPASFAKHPTLGTSDA